MTIEFSEEFETIIDKAIQYFSPKEKIYEYIDKLEKDENLDSYYYRDFKTLVERYKFYTSDDNINALEIFADHYLNYQFKKRLSEGSSNNWKMPIYEEIIENISNLFKQKNNFEFISSPDKTVIKAYSAAKSGYLEINNDVIHPDHILEKKLGGSFTRWSNEWSNGNINRAIHKVLDQMVNKHDSHKYSDKILQCFVDIDAASTTDFIEEVSQCQYAMYAGEISAQDL